MAFTLLRTACLHTISSFSPFTKLTNGSTRVSLTWQDYKQQFLNHHELFAPGNTDDSGFYPKVRMCGYWHRGEELFLNLNLVMNGASRHSPMCWMIPLTVGWNSSFIASQDIRSIPCEDHFTKFTLWVVKGTHKSMGQLSCSF